MHCPTPDDAVNMNFRGFSKQMLSTHLFVRIVQLILVLNVDYEGSATTVNSYNNNYSSESRGWAH